MAAMTAIGMAMPIAAASIVSVGLFAWAWRRYQYERGEAKRPWYLEISVVIIPLIYGIFIYLSAKETPVTYLQIFSAAMIAQMFTAAFLFSVSRVVWFPHRETLRDRVFLGLVAVGSAALILSGAFTG